jgi:hypothetical protein
VNKVDKVLALGVYPDVSLKLARERAGPGRCNNSGTDSASTRIDVQAARPRIGNVLLGDDADDIT